MLWKHTLTTGILRQGRTRSLRAFLFIWAILPVLMGGACSLAEAATAGPRGPSSSAGSNWTTPTNATVSNNNYATYDAATQDYLRLTDFGFAIPAGATINGVTVAVEGYSTGDNDTNRRYKVGLSKDGSVLAGAEKGALQFANTESTVTSGGASDLWGGGWTAAEINAATFGVLLTDNDTTASGTFFIDHITVTVDYTEAGNASPTLSVAKPNGVDDTVTVGDLYQITYSLADSDDQVTAAFHYDTDNVGLDGVAISGPCATAGEGSGVTCAWNTTGMTPGSYYVYGLASDGINPSVSAYSPGMITINPAGSGCVRNAPTFASSPSAQNAFLVGNATYTLTIINNDTAACAGTTFTIARNDTGDTAQFEPSSLSVGSVTLAPGASGGGILTVTPKADGVLGSILTTTVTVSDALYHAGMDQVDTATTTILSADNPLLHNSRNINSGKWGPEGWGISGGKYGRFSCATCHARGTPNVKRVRQTLTSGTVDAFPVGGGAVTFTDARGNPTGVGYGDDNNRAANRICESCHSQNKYHNYDMAANISSSHQNNSNCVACHKHNEGFRPGGCDGCHGDGAGQYWPTIASPLDTAYPNRIGSHQKHIDGIAPKLAERDGKLWGDLTAIQQLGYKNSACDRCHPNPGGNNRDGQGHNVNTEGSPHPVADLYNDGTYQLGEGTFKDYLNPDPDGRYNPRIKRCSNIDCHSNGEFTWTWYPDVSAPGAIADLLVGSADKTGTVKLSWTAPGNDWNVVDGHTGGVAYQYQVRYRTQSDGGIGDANWDSSRIAGGPPTVIRAGRAQTMTVYGLQPGSSYTFAVKTADEYENGLPPNWSPLSNVVAATAKVDTKKPAFYGLNSVEPAYASGAVDLAWGAAHDDTEPITYLLYWCLANQNIDYTAPNATTSGLNYQVTGLQNGVDYKFAVRAQDASPAQNIDGNTVVKEAIPQAPSEFDIFGKMYYAIPSSGVAIGGRNTNTLVSCDNDITYSAELFSLLNDTGYTCNADDKTEIKSIKVAGNIITWVFNTAYAKPMSIHGGTFSLYLRERSDTTGNNIWFDLGYWNPANGTFTILASDYKVIPRKLRGVVKSYFSPADGAVYSVPAGMKLAVRLRKETTKEMQIRFGSKKGPSLLTVYEQEENQLPGPFAVATPASPAQGTISIDWSAAIDVDGPEPVYYDVHGSIDGGGSYPFIIAKKLTVPGTTWNTVQAGIGLTAAQNNVRVRVGASDGLLHRTGVGIFEDHRYVSSGTFTIDNSIDTTPPAAITDLHAEHRPKGGTTWLYWTAPGDDGMEGKATQYDIRYALSSPDSPANAIDSEAKWLAASQVTGAPVPVVPGHTQGYELVGLKPGKNYYFAIRTGDETTTAGYPSGNWSPLSNSPKTEAGLRCGVCHSTPPDEPNRAGAHEVHGYTQTDCAKCHGEATDFNTLDHSDAAIKMAWNNPKKGFFNQATGPAAGPTADYVRYDTNGYPIYEDTDGPGGFNDFSPGGTNVDSGRCFNFNPQPGYAGVTGCHGPGEPLWDEPASVTCAMCHGSMDRGTKDPYGRVWEDQSLDSKYAGNVPIYKSAPGVDLLGNIYSNAVGQHERHLNISYRLTGDSCTLCHLESDHADGTVDVLMNPSISGDHARWNPGIPPAPGTCTGTSQVACHGDNATPPPWKTRDPEPNGPKVIECSECHTHEDNVFWPGATLAVAEAGRSSTIAGAQNGDGVRTTLTVSSTGNNLIVGDRFRKNGTFFQVNAKDGTTLTLHQPIPVGVNFANGEVLRTKHIPHTSDGGIIRPCVWCHVEGHPYGDETALGKNPPGQETVFIPNYVAAGIQYSSGGIHLRKNINNRGAKDSEAEICWTCHDANNISEWGVNSKANTGNSPYDYGRLYSNSALTTPTSNWVNAWWKSPNFAYKTGQVQSTHSANPMVTRPGVDTVAQIRCSYCHDVHDMNHAPGDTVNGKPFLRGTWMGNPYQEDGAPGRTAGWSALSNYNKANYYYDSAMNDFGMVPRGAVTMSKMGGYWIDQNSDYPTASWTLESSAGLCILCHGRDVNNMNKFTVKEDGVTPDDAWLGANGHSNAVIGGTGTNKFNVYSPAIRKEGYLSGGERLFDSRRPGMGYQDTVGLKAGETDRLYGLRNNMGNSDGRLTTGTPFTTDNNMGVYPYAWSTTEGRNRYAINEFGWGVSPDETAAEPMYHRFSCSKCHAPHASRLPRLMITNCLDVSHNKWDDTFAGDADWTSGRDNVSDPVNWSIQGVMPYTGNDVSGLARNRQFAYATSAQNCHRYVKVGTTVEEPGWNRVTPWEEDSTWYNGN